MERDNVVELAGIEVRRQGKTILKDLEWQVKPGENWVILGPNGAGKTTLIQMLTGRVFPTYRRESPATVRVLGQQLGRVDLTELRTLVGIASAAERSLLPGDQCVLDAVISILYGRTVRGREEYGAADLERARDLLSIFGIAHLAQRSLRTLSEGEIQRVHIARALMPDPQILILDEPTAGLDLGARELLMMALEEIAADRHAPALLLVTHHVEEIPRGFTHAALMSEGTIVASGAIEDVLADEVVSSVFGLPLTVTRIEGRWSARAR